MYFLTVRSSDGSYFYRNLDRSTLRTGRASDNDLVLTDPCVSRTHFEIVRQADGCYLIDLGSKAGTRVNSVPVTGPVRLQPGDRIAAGRTMLTFEATATPLPLDTESPTAGLELTPPREEPIPGSPGDAAMASSLAGRILDLDRELSFGLPVGEMLEKVMDLAGRAVPFDRGILMLRDEEGNLTPLVRRPPGLDPRSTHLSRSVIAQVVGRAEPFLYSGAFRGSPAEPDPPSDPGIRSALCVPLWHDRMVIGLIYLDCHESPVRYTPRHLEELAYLSGIAGAKIENARLFGESLRRQQKSDEFQEAAGVQRMLLPERAPDIPGYRLDGSTFPCEEVGGDYYDFVSLPGGRCGIAVADVAGHGLPAALLMSRFQALLSMLWEAEPTLDRMIRRLNQLLCQRMPENRYITLFCGILDPRLHSLAYVNAGHPAAWLVAPGGPDTPLPITGLFLGSFPEVEIRQATVPLGPESILVCPSDGVTEARDDRGEMFGEGRLTAAVRRHLGKPPGDIIAHLTAAVDLHRAGVRQADDMTLVVLARQPGRARE